MKVAKENIYVPLNDDGLSWLAVAEGGEVTDDDLKRLGLRKNDPRLDEVKPAKD
jgi:hypothetical protein